MTANASHGSLLEGTIAAGRLELDASHGSEMALKGTAESARLSASHGSELPLEGLAIRDAEVEVSHGSTVSIHSESEKGVKAVVEHASTLSGEIRGGLVELDAEHGARATLKGAAGTAKVTGGFSSTLQLRDLTVEVAEVELSHGATATVHATKKLDYDVEFASRLKYLGNPEIGRSSKSHGASAGSAGPDDRPDDGTEKPANADRERQRTSLRARWDGDGFYSISLGSWREAAKPSWSARRRITRQ